MYTVKCLNPIASKGLDLFTEDFKVIDDLDKADAVLVRSAAMHDLAVPESLLAVARAGAGVNNIPLDEYAKKGIVAFNTPGANANGVKELVVAGLLLASRDIIGGYNWVKENASEENLAKLDEKYANGELTEKKYNEALADLTEKAYGAEGALKAKYAATLAGKEGMSGLLSIVSAAPEDFDKLTNAIYNRSS